MSNKTQFFPVDFITDNGLKTVDGGFIPGLSNETKPTEGIPRGTVYYEMDTKKAFMFDGNLNWYEM